MKEDRSWVAPLAFVTFGGIIVAAIVAFLQMEDLLLTERGSALVAWLTFVFTSGAFGAALFAVSIALKQMGHDKTQANIAIINELKLRIENIEDYKAAIHKLKFTIVNLEVFFAKGIKNRHLSKENREEKDFTEIILNTYKKDYYGDSSIFRSKNRDIILNTANNIDAIFIIAIDDSGGDNSYIEDVFYSTSRNFKAVEQEIIDKLRKRENELRRQLNDLSGFG